VGVATDPVINNSEKIIHITKNTQRPIKLDGVLDDDVWKAGKKYSDFWMKFPSNESLSEPKTEIQVTYDDKFLYFGITVFETEGGNIVQSLKRDQGLRAGDGIGVVLDPVNLKTNGFYFSVSPFNSQTEGLIGNSTEEITFTWDNTWHSNTKAYDGYWTAEMAIPFSILRYDFTKKIWGINFIRSARSENEFHTWTNMPLQFPGTDLGYLGQMVWDQNPPQSSSKVSLNPYVTGGLSADAENGQATKITSNAGFDAKVSLTSSLNLDLTVNPDFSNVDVDQQVTNLSRFSIFFPERRVFFLENDDLFSGFGIPPIRPFYSRRIGSKNGEAVPILFGARLSGNVTKKLRVGIMNIQTGRKGENSADNFTTATFSRQVMERSVFKGYFINRSAFQSDAEKISDPLGAFGRNAGSEFLYTSKSGLAQAWAGIHISSKPGLKGQNIYNSIGGGHFGKNFTSFVDFTHLGKNYYADLGFINRVENYDAQRDTTIRVGFNFGFNQTQYTWYPEKGNFNTITLGGEHFLVYDDKFDFNEVALKYFTNFGFRNTGMFTLGFNVNQVNLLFPYKFVDDEASEPLPTGSYHFNNVFMELSSDVRKNFVASLEAAYGKFYNAGYTQLSGSIKARKQPYFSLALAVEYNDLKFPIPYGQQKFWLVAPQMEVNFSNAVFWTSFLQWNSQADNFNINSRIQWRYRPMSDIFLVYTDNYFTDTAFVNKNRAIVLKINYWLNI
jgi:hypothetical protein